MRAKRTTALFAAALLAVGMASSLRSEEEPDGYRMSSFRAPTPETLRGARVIDTDDAHALWRAHAAIFVDVMPRDPRPGNLPEGTIWRQPPRQSIPGAAWLPNVGYGAISPETDGYFRSRLEKLTNGDKQAALVIFCLRHCWMSWNAAKRAASYGYTGLIWFPAGVDGWSEQGLPIVDTQPWP